MRTCFEVDRSLYQACPVYGRCWGVDVGRGILDDSPARAANLNHITERDLDTEY